MSIEEIKIELKDGWHDVPAADLALCIIDFMAKLDDQELRMLPIPLLLEVSGRKEPDPEFFAALAILVSSTIHVLDAKAFYTEEEDHEFHIDTKELARARREGELVHPESGALIDDFESKLIPYFESSGRFLAARSDA